MYPVGASVKQFRWSSFFCVAVQINHNEIIIKQYLSSDAWPSGEEMRGISYNIQFPTRVRLRVTHKTRTGKPYSFGYSQCFYSFQPVTIITIVIVFVRWYGFRRLVVVLLKRLLDTSTFSLADTVPRSRGQYHDGCMFVFCFAFGNRRWDYR